MAIKIEHFDLALPDGFPIKRFMHGNSLMVNSLTMVLNSDCHLQQLQIVKTACHQTSFVKKPIYSRVNASAGI